MKVGEIRGPVKTQFGYHILKLVGIQEATTKTFEQSRTDLESDYRRSEAERQFNSLQDELADAALQSATDIDAVARKAGLPVQQIVDFSRSEGGGALGKSPKAIEAAFSQEALDGRVSSIVEIEKGRGIVLKASDHKLPQQRSLEAVRTDLIKAWKEQRGTGTCVGRGGGCREASRGRRELGCDCQAPRRTATGAALRRAHRRGRAA